MKAWIGEDFLLRTASARRLYHDHARHLPIIDYHNHLDPQWLADDRRFETISEVWIAGDPYKHRAMRIAGLAERFITGDATAREKFERWAAVVPQTLGNPLYDWSALELLRYFGIGEPLTPESAERIWIECNRLLPTAGFSARGLIARSNVESLCTSDQLLDDLAAHGRLGSSGFATRVLPSLRADEIVDVGGADYVGWVKRLGAATGLTVDSWDAFRQSVEARLDLLDQAGCRLADQALDDFVYERPDERSAARLIARRLGGECLAAEEAVRLRSEMLRFLGTEYARRGWAMQLHLGAQRQTSSRLRRLAGPSGGYAALGRTCDVGSLCRFLDDLEIAGSLPRTILYTLNPADNAVLASLTGSFTGEGVRGKLQFGPAWWYNDHRAGIRRHLEDLASFGLLATFIGMTTDSRSLLSMSRHEYFRRILCDYLGQQVKEGAYPADESLLGRLVRDVCYENPRRWIFNDKAPDR